MGNTALRRVSEEGCAQVLQTDGKIIAYDYPVTVAKVLKEHPDHLLVHCAQGKSEQRARIAIMRSDQSLVLGQSYILYPIPAQYKTSFAKSKCCSASSRKVGCPIDQKGHAKWLKHKMSQVVSRRCLKSAPSFKPHAAFVSEGDTSLLLEGDLSDGEQRHLQEYN